MDLTMKVLIVDDFATMRRLMVKCLKQIGFSKIIEADDGTTALMELKKQKFDLIISDLNMPEVTGIELLNTVRSNAEFKDIPFVMVTAEAAKENIIEAVKAGISNYIIKPFTVETLNEKLCNIFDD